MKRTRFHSYEDLLAAARELQAKIPNAALLGGLAMQLYGSPRLTTDVDFAVDLSFAALSTRGVTGKKLTIGGIRTVAANGVEVDIIVRDDDWSTLYIAAVQQAQTAADVSLRVVAREYLLVIKIASGRPKDEEDAKFLLKQLELNFDRTLKLAYAYLGNYGARELRQLREIARWEQEREQKETKE